jgi:hypothetical protein
MKYLNWLAIASLLAACAHGKMGDISQPLNQGSIDKKTPIYVEAVSADDARFSGDKSGDVTRVAEEKSTIAGEFNRRIAEALRKRGYNAKAVNQPAKSGLVLTGKVTKVEHGSAAARILVGMGSGAANMFTDFKLEDRTAAKTLGEFQVIATSGGEGGLNASGSYVETHLNDGAKKTAEYIDNSNSGVKVKK